MVLYILILVISIFKFGQDHGHDATLQDRTLGGRETLAAAAGDLPVRRDDPHRSLFCRCNERKKERPASNSGIETDAAVRAVCGSGSKGERMTQNDPTMRGMRARKIPQNWTIISRVGVTASSLIH